MSSTGLVYIGKVIDIQPIEGADFIASATVVCGAGGKWRGVIRKMDIHLGDSCVVFLPDSQLSPDIHFWMTYMKDSNWRVKMRRFKGAPSEVLITEHGTTIAYMKDEPSFPVGTDVTERMRVVKYHKPVPAHLQGKMVGEFPGFIPKTDEPNYQNAEGQEYLERLQGQPFYITEKCDGSSTTAFRYKGKFGVCSRNLELERDENNGYWQMAIKYELESNLPEGFAIQWETCGPGIQSNPMGLSEISAFAFSGYNIAEHRYLTADELVRLLDELNFPCATHLDTGNSFDGKGVELLGEGKYRNGKQREGVVVRSRENLLGGKPISFKVINLNYEK
jgi:RNA ligase (TIGR02306 family)